MSPTPRGAEIANAAREILLDVEQKLGARVPFDPGRAHRPFTFAMSDVGEMVFLPKLLRALAKHSPDTPVRSVSMRPDQLTKAMEDGQVDLAIGYFPDLKGSDFSETPLHSSFRLSPARRPSGGGNSLTLDQFVALPHAVVLSEGRSQEILEEHLKELGLLRRVAIYTPHFLSIPALLAQSDMVVTILCNGDRVRDAGLRPSRLQLPCESPRIQLRQHWHTKFQKDTRNVWLRGIVSELFNLSTDEWQPSQQRGRSTTVPAES